MKQKENFTDVLITDAEYNFVMANILQEYPDKRKYPHPRFRKYGYTVENYRDWRAALCLREGYSCNGV